LVLVVAYDCAAETVGMGDVSEGDVMSWGNADAESDLWRGWKLEKVPPGFSFVRYFWNDAAGCSDLLCGRSTGRLKGMLWVLEFGEHRVHLADVLRNQFWWLRNRRWGGTDERSAEAVSVIRDGLQLLEVVGVPVPDLVMIGQCMASPCVCLGCDCKNGERVRELSVDQRSPLRGREAQGVGWTIAQLGGDPSSPWLRNVVPKQTSS
jgi:hypothetical protein